MRPPGNDRRGPRGKGTASSVVQAGEAENSLAYETPAVIDGAPAVVVFDAARSRAEDISRRLMGASRGEREAYLEGRTDGYVHGIERGRELADDEAQWPMRLAEQHIRRLSEIEPHEPRWQRAVGVKRSSREDDLLLLANVISSDGWRAVPA